MSDLISRKGVFIPDITVEMFRNASLESIEDLMASGEMEDILLPSAQPTLLGYNIEHLELIASVLQRENLPPERLAEVLTDIGRIVAMVKDDVEEALRQALNNLPPAQPERPRGEWIMTKEFDEDVATCPFCGAEMRRKSTGEKPEPPNFCSKCGADLRGKQQ